MPGIEQALRMARVITPFGDDTLALGHISGRERLSTLFCYEVECISEDGAVDLDKLIGKDITVAFELQDGGTRHINGIATTAAQHGTRGEYHAYRLTLEPWLWLLDRTSDCRIFTDLSVPDIVQQVFDDNGYSDVDNRLNGNYATWHYCVQYRETDFAFVSRLMEHEGIYYFFEHAAGKTTLVLCDSPTAHNPAPGYATVSYFADDPDQLRDEEQLARWQFGRQVCSGKYVMNDFGFDQPKRDLVVFAANRVTDAYEEFELYEYPAALPNADSGALERSYGEQLASRRLELEQALYEVATGSGNVRGLTAGCLFTLEKAPREDQNREYLVVQGHIELSLDSYFSGAGGAAVECRMGIECIDSQRQFRPPRLTRKPRIHGPQTAIVAGPAGEEIWTDSHGRVKVQFHWDRYGSADENSSRWVRVSQAWAGEGWGGIHIPRIGQEVIVEYIDGDPDRPIITGRVYNGDRPVPYGLPANATQSGIKSRSSMGGAPANFNEIRMEDKKGAEELYVHAEKDQNNVVENDETTSVGHDRSESVGNDETIEIGNDRTETVAKNESITIGVNRTEQVGADETVTIGGNRSVTVARNKAETVAINKAESIGAAKQLNIGGNYAITVGRDGSAGYGGTSTVDVAKDAALTVGKSRKIDIADDQSTKVGKTLTLEAGDEIVIRTGKASIRMKKDGTIDIAGKDISIKGSGAVNVKASKNIVMKGSKILQN